MTTERLIIRWLQIAAAVAILGIGSALGVLSERQYVREFPHPDCEPQAVAERFGLELTASDEHVYVVITRAQADEFEDLLNEKESK